MIKDSGSRREFPSGAVRDDHEVNGEPKGRCDLMPLQVVARLLEVRTGDYIIKGIAAFTEKQDTKCLYAILLSFVHLAYRGQIETMLLELAVHFENGAKKYGENNWQKGLPVNCYLDSALRHYFKWRRGDKDENHAAAFVWNVTCCIWEVDYHENKTAEN